MISPYELWEQSGRDGVKYRELMREHGLIRDLAPGEKPEPLPCGWPAKRVADSPELVEARAEIERLLALGRLATKLRAEHPDQRAGQAAFNALVQLEPKCAEVVRGMAVDPFYRDDRLPAFWDFVGDWIGGS